MAMRKRRQHESALECQNEQTEFILDPSSYLSTMAQSKQQEKPISQAGEPLSHSKSMDLRDTAHAVGVEPRFESLYSMAK